MIAVNRPLCLFALLMTAAPLHDALAQANLIQGAWLEEGVPCASVFEAKTRAIGFKRSGNIFAPAFIITQRRLSTPWASCRVVSVTPSSERQVVRLSCTTAIATDSARVILARSEDGGLYRFNSVEGGIASKYRLCNRESLKTP